MNRFYGILGILVSVFMFVVFIQQDIWIGLYLIPAGMFSFGVSMLLGENKSQFETLNNVKSISDKVGIGVAGIFALFIVIGLLGNYDSCEEQYRKAWEACNKKYNGKCSYLGKDFKPSCKLENY